MIKNIYIRNYKSIKEQWITLERINLFIGANGSGKSNFINFFNLIRAIAQGKIQEYTALRGGAKNLLHLGSDMREPFDDLLLGSIYFSDFQYLFQLGVNDLDSFFLRSELCQPISESKPGEEYAFLKNWIPDNTNQVAEATISFNENDTARLVRDRLESILIYHFHDTSIRGPLRQRSSIFDSSFLTASGDNLASILYKIELESRLAFNRITSIVRRVAPYFDRFVLKPEGDFIRLKWQQKGTDRVFDVSDLSDGTIRFIALTTLLAQPNLPPVVIIDEPELGLHPYAVSMLAGLMQSISLKTQLVISTQSVELVNLLDLENIVVVENKDNQSTFTRFNRADYQDWLTEYSVGDLWQKNIIGGNP